MKTTNSAIGGRRDTGATGLRAAVATLTILLAACASEGHTELASGDSPDAGPACALDGDHDGYGIGCAMGIDCDDNNASITNECYSCLPPRQGCACHQEGLTTKCGEVSTQVGNSVSCISGERTCSNGAWGQCVGSLTEAQSLTPKGLGGATTCANNPCDPYCQHFPDDPDPGMTGLDGGATSTDDGIKLIPGPVSGGPAETCVNESAEAKPIPLDIIVMVDTSGSMADSYYSPESGSYEKRWSTAVKPALDAFVKSSASLGIGFGIQRFPQTNCTDGSATCMCSSTTYKPLKLNDLVAALDYPTAGGHSSKVLTEIGNWNMTGGTPTPAALNGAILRAIDHAASNSTHKTVVVLATDGDPTYCPGNGSSFSQDALNAAAAAADTGFKHVPSIPTYVIGVGAGANAAHLNTVARAGQGITNAALTPAYMVTGGDSSAFLTAMNDIRKKALPCEFTVPVPASGTLDPSTTKLTYTPGGTGTPQLWSKVTACVAGQNGWYYDNNATPTKILLCETSCNTVKADINAKIGFDYSCVNDCSPKTIQAKPMPLNMYVMLDRSGSMNETIAYSGGITRATRIKDALKAFTADTKSEGIKLALNYFAQFDSGYVCDNSHIRCDSAAYETPAVAFNTLVSPNAAAVSSSLDSTSICSGTPMAPALVGAATKAKAVQTSTSEKTVVVLATDGLPTACAPTACDTVDATPCLKPSCNCDWYYVKKKWSIYCDTQDDITNCFNPCIDNQYYTCAVSDVAAKAEVYKNGTPSIKTYVIGAGADATMATFLNTIANKGGTSTAFIANDSDPTAFVNAMNAIRAAELPCDYSLPAPAAGQLDPSATKVFYTATLNGTKETWAKVANSASCPANANGWYYDNATTPTKAVLCPYSCNRARTDLQAKVEFEYACVGEYAQGSFTREYDMTGQCPPSSAPVWGIWSWDADIPNDSKINFEVSVKKADGTFSAYVPLVYVKPNTPLPSWWQDALSGTAVGANTATNKAFTVVDYTLGLNALPRQSLVVRIRSNLFPSSNKLSTPTLKGWDIQVSCQASE